MFKKFKEKKPKEINSEVLPEQEKSIKPTTKNDDKMNFNVGEEEKTEVASEKPQKKRSKYPIYIGIILIITGFALYLSLKDNFNEVITTLFTCDPLYLSMAILCFVGSFIVDALILYLFARRFKKRYYFHQGLANNCVGVFYNAVTPSATGGQIMQAYTFKKQGIPISNATSCLVMNFIVYQFVVVCFGIFAFAFSFNTIMGINAIEMTIGGAAISIPMWLFVTLGFSLETFVILLIFVMSYSKWFHNFILNQGVDLFAKMHIVKKPDETRRRLAVQVESFKIELKSLFTNPVFLLVIVLLTAFSFCIKYITPYFLNIAVLHGTQYAPTDYTYDWAQTLSLASFHKMVTELIPIPGGAGVSEWFYYVLFSKGYSPKIIEGGDAALFVNSAQILWRSITFYVPLVIAGLVTAFYKGSPRDEGPVTANYGTYIDLQMETIDQRKSEYETLYSTKILSAPENKLKNKIQSFKNRKNGDKDKDKDKNGD
ncbi:MAG: lysylphosphatidylglycerol synthase transmembrane domain-containing protein [Bacilli bacterium]